VELTLSFGGCLCQDKANALECQQQWCTVNNWINSQDFLDQVNGNAFQATIDH
jgi:hypothetical protein